ncbi:MAG: hypothetical protein IPN44_10005 [Flavobacteriales bacterium]|nr:hypothetical protein [Flavobacteriales bacterium]
MNGRSLLLLMASWFLCLTEASAQITWQATYGGNSTDEGNSVLVSMDGNYLVVGSTGSFGAGSGDIYVLMLDPYGVKIWSRTLGGPGIDQGRKVVQAPDGGFVLAGITNSSGNGGYDGYVAKIAVDGTLLWEHTYGGEGWDLLYSISNTPDGGFITAGETFSSGAGGGDAWTVKLSAEGDLQWERTYGGAEEDFVRSVITTSEGGFLIAGATTVVDDQNAWLVKLDESGNVTWDTQAGGDSLDYANSVIQTADGGYAAVGTTKSYSIYSEALHFKLDATGSLQWLRNWGQVNNQESLDQVELADGRLLSVGYVNTSGSGGKDMFIFFSSADGDFLAGISNGGDNGAGDEYGYSVAIVPDGGFVFCGYTESFGFGTRDVYLVKTDSVGLTQSIAVDSYFDPLSIQTSASLIKPFYYPDPTSGMVLLSEPTSWSKMVLFDATGRTMRSWAPPYGTLGFSDLTDGTYFLRGTDRAGQVVTSPLILQKH